MANLREPSHSGRRKPHHGLFPTLCATLRFRRPLEPASACQSTPSTQSLNLEARATDPVARELSRSDGKASPKLLSRLLSVRRKRKAPAISAHELERHSVSEGNSRIEKLERRANFILLERMRCSTMTEATRPLSPMLSEPHTATSAMDRLVQEVYKHTQRGDSGTSVLGATRTLDLPQTTEVHHRLYSSRHRDSSELRGAILRNIEAWAEEVHGDDPPYAWCNMELDEQMGDTAERVTDDTEASVSIYSEESRQGNHFGN